MTSKPRIGSGKSTASPKRKQPDQFEQAQADRLAAENEVARISAQHLAKLLKRPPAERLSHITDPALVPADRNRLRLAIERDIATRTSSGRRGSWASRPAKVSLSFYDEWSSAVRTGLALFATFSVVLFALGNTAYRGTLRQDIDATFRDPGGANRTRRLARGDVVYPTSRAANGAGYVEIRSWVPREGYERTLVPESVIQP